MERLVESESVYGGCRSRSMIVMVMAMVIVFASTSHLASVLPARCLVVR